jgi:hypothetical protein
MRIATAATPVQRFGIVEPDHDFSIKPTPKAFQILCSKLYKDKITAIIRELSCNAFDSHVEAGRRERAFDVQLPDSLHPELVIRDYGTGLSDRSVRTVFTTFFESTKEDTNDQIGALGLGCKSPFSYTDTYTVKSFFNGRCTTYVCFIENSLPKIKRVSIVETDEENGLEIRIAVRPQDFVTFRTKASNVYRWFDVHPNVKGLYSQSSPPKAIQKGKDADWFYVGGTEVTRAIMGQVSYPLDEGVLSNHLGELERRLLKSFILRFGIGDLDVQAGREELSYDTATIRVIKKRLKKVSQEIGYYSKAEFSDCKNIVEATQKVIKLGLYGLFAIIPPRFNGKVVTKELACPTKGKLVRRNGTPLEEDNFYRRRRKTRQVVTTTTISPLPNHIIFIDDLKRGGISRFKKFSYETRYLCYLFTPHEDIGVEEALKAFADYPDVRLISDIKVERQTAKVRVLSRDATKSISQLSSGARREVNIDLNKTNGVFLFSKSHTLLGPEGKGGYVALIQMLITLYWRLEPDAEVYVVPWTLRKQFVEHEGWMTIYDYIFEEVEHRLADKEFVHGIHVIRDRENFPKNLFDRGAQVAERLNKRHPFRKFHERASETVSPSISMWMPLLNLMHNNNQMFGPGKAIFDGSKLKLQKYWDQLDHLPLLRAVATSAPLDAEALDDLAMYAMNKTIA